MRHLGLSLLLVVVISIVGAGWAVDRLFARLATGNDAALQVAEQLGYRLRSLVDADILVPLDQTGIDDAAVHRIDFIARDNMVLPADLERQLETGEVVMLESGQGVALHFLLPASQRVMVIRIPNEEVADTPLRLLLTICFYTAIALLVLGWLYPLVRRLQRLTTAARAIGDGDLSQCVDTNPHSQLHGIESEFNAMAERIQTLMDDNRLLSSAVSHDLRTPLARLRFGLDALEETLVEPLQQAYLERISNDLSRMEQLVEVLLEFARLEQQLDHLPRIPVSLSGIITDAVKPYCSGQQCTIELVGTQESHDILADERYTLMLVNNLLNNALKFATRRVKLTLEVEQRRLRLHVEDDGAGFDSADAARLFKPFQRGRPDAVPTTEQRGYGLGLAIVERIAHWQGARVTLGNSADLGGACVSVSFDSV